MNPPPSPPCKKQKVDHDNKCDMKNIKIKILRSDMKHYGVDYTVGQITKLPPNEKFNRNKHKTCGKGGIYTTTAEHIESFFKHGTLVGEIEFPSTEQDPDYECIKISPKKMRSSSVIITKTFSLYDPATYERYGTEVSMNGYIVKFAIQEGNLEFLKMYQEMFKDDGDILRIPNIKVHNYMYLVSDQDTFDWLLKRSEIFRDSVSKFCSKNDNLKTPWIQLSSYKQEFIKIHAPLLRELKDFYDPDCMYNYLKLVLRHEDSIGLLEWAFKTDKVIIENWIKELDRITDYKFSTLFGLVEDDDYEDEYEYEDDDIGENENCIIFDPLIRSKSYIKLVTYVLHELKSNDDDDDGNDSDGLKKRFLNSLLRTSSSNGTGLIHKYLLRLHQYKSIGYAEFEKFICEVSSFADQYHWDKKCLSGNLSFDEFCKMDIEMIKLFIRHGLMETPIQERFSLIKWHWQTNKKLNNEKLLLLQCQPKNIDQVTTTLKNFKKSSNSNSLILLDWITHCCPMAWFTSQSPDDISRFLSTVMHATIYLKDVKVLETVLQLGIPISKEDFKKYSEMHDLYNQTYFCVWIKAAIQYGHLDVINPEFYSCDINNIKFILDRLKIDDDNKNFIFNSHVISECLTDYINDSTQSSFSLGYDCLTKIYKRGQKMDYSSYFTLSNEECINRTKEQDLKALEFAKSHGLDFDILTPESVSIIKILETSSSTLSSRESLKEIIIPIDKETVDKLNIISDAVKEILSDGDFVIVHRSRLK